VPGPEWQRAVVSVGDLLLAFGLGGWVFVGSRFHRSWPAWVTIDCSRCMHHHSNARRGVAHSGL